MIKFDKVSYSFPQKDLYTDVSFTIEEGQHCAFIGASGSGKSTLIDIIMDPEKYVFDGKVEMEPSLKIGYVSQFSQRDKDKETTVFEYIAEEFIKLENEIATLCAEMGTSDDIETLLEKYQEALDAFDAIDGDNYENNINKKLNAANLTTHRDRMISELSGGEFKLIQVIKEMLNSPDLMIMDEPDVFLDFEHLNALKDLINGHKGTLLVITHNRYLLNHCFNKILHLENAEIQEFDGTYADYNLTLLQMKIEQQELAASDMEEIERNRKVVERLRNEATKFVNAARGKTLKARVSLLERLEARKTRSPFVEIKQPDIHLSEGSFVEKDGENLLEVENYNVSFDRKIMEAVSFVLKKGEKAAIVGPNGTGKTTILRDIYKNENPAIRLSLEVQKAYLSQNHGEVFDESATVLQNFEDTGFEKDADVIAYLKTYGFEEEMAYNRVENLSGGEKNLLQIARIARMHADLLLLDEPTSHLDTYSQMAFEQALARYQGTVLMVSHDFYTVANCMDYVLWVEDHKLRKVSIRKFRKMIYADHFDKDYLELEQKKKEAENRVAFALQAGKYEDAKKYCQELEMVIDAISGK